MKLVSVIIPVFNGEKTIERCIKSVLRQTYSPIEIIIIDDGSLDTTLRICTQFLNDYNNIVVLSQKNAGVVTAREKAISVSHGEYISFLDADDEMNEIMISKMVEQIEKYETDIVICGYENVSEGRHFKCIPRQENVLTGCTTILNRYMDSSILGFIWNRLYKRELFEDIKIDKNLTVCEDLFLNCLILKNNPYIRVSIVNEALYLYYTNADSVTHTLSKKITKDRKWKYTEAYKKICELFEEGSESYIIIYKAYLVCVRLGIEELQKEKEYIDIKTKLMEEGKRCIIPLLQTDFPLKYKIGWIFKVLLG